MIKISLSFILMGMLLPGAPTQPIPELNPLTPITAFEIRPIKKLPDQMTTDSFGLMTRGGITLKKEIASGEQIKPMITLSDVTAGLKLYGLFPDREAILNSTLWKINSRLTVRFQNHDYVLTLKEVTDHDIKIGWLENESLHQISLLVPSSEAILEQPDQIETETSESMLVLETPENHNPLKLQEKKR